MLTPPPPLTRFEKGLLVTLTLLIALTRLYALSLTPWEWDEMLFSTAVREYDVMEHHPHPPGFPLFIAAAKVIRLTGASDFHALQFIVTLAAMSLFPLVVMLARHLGFPLASSIGGGLLLSFAPNVWYYGGTAFSDVPALVITLAASILLLRAADPEEWRPAMFGGALLLGIAIAFRPQAALVAGVPMMIAAWRHRRNVVEILLAFFIAASVAIASYAGAGAASGALSEYVIAVEKQEHYVRDVDSYRSATRPPLPSLFKTFFKPTRGAKPLEKVIPAAAAVGGVAAAVTNPWSLVLLAMFAPLNVFSWLMLDFTAASRYTISYAPMYMILAAHGFFAITAPLRRMRGPASAAICTLLAGFFAWRALPALREVRSHAAPPVAACDWVRSHLDPHRVRIYTTDGVEPFTTYYLRGYDVVVFQTGEPIPEDAPQHDSWFVIDKRSRAPGAENFARSRGPLWDIARQRYFEASVAPIGATNSQSTTVAVKSNTRF